MTNNLPILYSFRRCPYAIRARMAIAYAGIPVEIREVELKNKPEHLLAISPKGTVPVLLLTDGAVIEESLEIMDWALAQHDPEHWLLIRDEADRLIKWNDGDFKYYLDRYKYADRYPDFSKEYYRQQAEVFLTELETRLMNSRYLCGNNFSLADAAIFPFIRQFVSVDKDWFQTSAFRALNNWLEAILATELFGLVMSRE
jgi:glutathione S-transferase